MKSVMLQRILIVLSVCSAAASRKHPECRSPNCLFHDKELEPNVYIYTINGQDQKLKIMYDAKEKLFHMCCNNNPSDVGVGLAADDPALPVMPKPTVVKTVEIRKCIVPKGSYRAALAALNISLDHEGCTLQLTEVPEHPQLEGYHLEEFGSQIKELLVTADTTITKPKYNFLANLTMLEKLTLRRLIKPEIEVTRHLPTSLKNLTLWGTGLLLQKDNSWLGRLKALQLLNLEDGDDAKSFDGSVTLPPLVDLPNLTTVILLNLPLEPLSDSTMWLRGSNLKELTIESCKLDNLPDKLFEGANINKIFLRNNGLINLNDAFAPLQSSLIELDLSSNLLNGETLISALDPLKNLETLIATFNPLRSLCGNGIVQGHLSSRLPTSLRRLELVNTGARVICDDWIESESLVDINLNNNQIKHLRYSDLQMRRHGGKPVLLNLKNNKLRIDNITQSDFEECLKANSSENRGNYYKRVTVHLKLDSFDCDCNVYWLREMLNKCSLLKAFDVTCETKSGNSIPLLERDPQLLTCPYCGVGCPKECSLCEKRPSDNATVVWCEAAQRLPQDWPPNSVDYPLALHLPPKMLNKMPHGLSLVELHAPFNNITQLDKDDIPITLRVLDVRNNSIEKITSSAAKKLQSMSETSGPWKVLLAGNLLTCGCEDEEAISKLKNAKISDWDKMQCEDHELVKEKTRLCHDVMRTNPTMLPALVGMGLLVMLTLAALILFCLRPRIKQFLFDHNWCLRYVLNVKDDVNDPTKSHNVFLSYSHVDEACALILAKELERHGHRVIIHSLHFEPGKTIMQNVVDAVLSARRTLLLVSDNFAKSDWGLEEFRTAHAHALERESSRVIVVRYNLNDHNELPQELQIYLCHNTYLDWNDPHFLKKLLRVMPPPQDKPQPEIARIHDKMMEPAFQIRLVPEAVVDSGLSLSRMSLDKEIPLSELVLVPPVQQNKHGPQEQSKSSPITPVVREPPQLSNQESPLSTEIKRGPLSAMRTPSVVYV